jgi:hypothetical protein
MIIRRTLVLAGVLAALGTTDLQVWAAPPASDPAAIINAIYARAAQGKGDVGPVDFDPVTNSQEPDVKSFKVVAEKLEPDKAVIAVTITGRNTPRPKPADLAIQPRSPPVYCQTGGAGSLPVLLSVLRQVLIAQVPVLPQLQGRQQHHQPAET